MCTIRLYENMERLRLLPHDAMQTQYMACEEQISKPYSVHFWIIVIFL